jgi:hypothetical protein
MYRLCVRAVCASELVCMCTGECTCYLMMFVVRLYIYFMSCMTMNGSVVTLLKETRKHGSISLV